MGYSPFLSFRVLDLQDTVMKMMELGGTLDGPIKYPPQGKVVNCQKRAQSSVFLEPLTVGVKNGLLLQEASEPELQTVCEDTGCCDKSP